AFCGGKPGNRGDPFGVGGGGFVDKVQKVVNAGGPDPGESLGDAGGDGRGWRGDAAPSRGAGREREGSPAGGRARRSEGGGSRAEGWRWFAVTPLRQAQEA